MTKNTIDDRTGQYMLFGCECGRLDSETIADVLGGEVTENLKQALYQDLMALVGDGYGKTPKELDDMTHPQWKEYADKLNYSEADVDESCDQVVRAIRQNINQYFGKENQ